ncbi:MAG TPA: hypothetical protein DCY55_01790 [Gammaproteobacteria bacterium]|jgi:hypothetical protein|nr:hypothetical protein [Gammaproteobacteria bacterium]
MKQLLNRLTQSPRVVSVSLLITLACATYTASAHHGWSGYTEDFNMTAQVVNLRFGNPHDQIWVEDEQGSEWNFLLAPPARNRKFGFDENIIAIGDTVDIFGQRSKTETEGKVHVMKNATGDTIYTYYYDSGQTSLERQGR